MSKIHALNTLTDALDTADYATVDYATLAVANDGQLDNASAAAGVMTTTAAAPALTQVLYLTETGETTAINVADINQGQLGDCYLLSSIGEIALLKPTFISNMIHVNSNGTETVTLYEGTNGRLPATSTAALKAVSVTVTNTFPTDSVNNAATQDVLKGQKEIWPQVLEKAYATLNGSYTAIGNGGSPLLAMEELTGHAASFMSPASLTLAALNSYVAAGDMLVFDTLSSGALPNNLVNGHAYMFEGVTGSGATAMAHFGNPWGFDQPSAMLLSQVSRGFGEVDIGHFS
jgi:hypothetical protein